MKRILFVVSCLLLCFPLMADHHLEVVKGEKPVFKEGDTAVIELDMSETTWEDTETMKHHFDEYEKLLESISDMFRITFNRNSTTLKIKDTDTPKYKFVLRPSNFFCKVGSFYKKYTYIWGDLDIIDCASDDILCSIQITQFKGRESDYVEAESVVKCISYLAEQLTKEIPSVSPGKKKRTFEDGIYSEPL